jgi:hypothetical protein
MELASAVMLEKLGRDQSLQIANKFFDSTDYAVGSLCFFSHTLCVNGLFALVVLFPESFQLLENHS